ncbi:MAG TPA: transporter substrate-binding domain-containing protein, partial [Nocardioidaceae bacterium]
MNCTKRTRFAALGAAALLAATLTACGDDSESGGSTDVDVSDNPTFEAGTTMEKLADAGKITIGVKIDQPGIGNLEPGADAPEGFDIEIGRILAGALGIDDDSINWKETISDNRESFIQGGDVDLVIASYSITDDR